MIDALNRATESERTELINILDNQNNSEEDIARAVQIMDKSGALKHCHEEAMTDLDGAKETLRKYPEGDSRSTLEELLEYMVTRGH